MLGLIIAIIYLVTNFVFALGLTSTANFVTSSGKPIRFAPLPFWFLAALFNGPIMALAFWIIHCSSLSVPPSSTEVSRSMREQLHEEGILVYGKKVSDEQVEEYLS